MPPTARQPRQALHLHPEGRHQRHGREQRQEPRRAVSGVNSRNRSVASTMSGKPMMRAVAPSKMAADAVAARRRRDPDVTIHASA